MLTRREVIWSPAALVVAGLLFVGVVAAPVRAHAPYRQWVVYRSERLMVVTGKWRPDDLPLAKQVAADINASVPEAQAEATRAPNLRRITQLLNSRQIDVAVVSEAEAAQLARGEGEARFEGPVDVQVLAFLTSPRVLIANADLARDQGYLIVFGLYDEQGSALPQPARPDLPAVLNRAAALGLQLHAGAADFLAEALRGGAPPPDGAVNPE